jgi:hypothetical protein
LPIDENLIENCPFNEEFCRFLEYRLGEAFENSENEKFNGFWCDGVSWLPSPLWQLTQKNVNDTRKINTTSWLGKDGQDKYDTAIHFGKYSLRRYAKGTSLIDCIPSPETMDWIEIDMRKKFLSLYLK